MDFKSILKQNTYMREVELWHAKDVSFGVARNKNVENMIATNKLTIINDDIKEVFCEGKLFLCLPKQDF